MTRNICAHFQPGGLKNVLMTHHELKNLLKSTKVISLIIALIAFTSYLPSLYNDFVFDDYPAIINNKDAKSDRTHLYSIFFNDFWGTPITKEESHKSYRPLTVFTFRCNYWLHHLNAFGFHLVNLILHSIVSALFYNFALQYISGWCSFFSGLLFAFHPVHVDAVASIVGRAELLSALLFKTCLLYYCKNQKLERSALLVVFLSLLATLCKEQGSTVILVCLLYDFILKQKLVQKISKLKMRKMILKPDSKEELIDCNKNWTLNDILRKVHSINQNIVILLFGFFLITFGRLAIVKYKFPSFSKFDNPAQNLASPYRQLSYAHLWTLNWWLLIYPFSLSCDWSSQSIANITSLFDLANLFTLIFISIFILAIVKSDSIIFMNIGIMVISFLPASNIFFPLGFVLAERVLYLPSMGYCIIIGRGLEIIYGIFKDYSSKSRLLKILFQLGIVLLLTSHAFKTIKRCYQWKDELILFDSGLLVNPKNVKLLNNLGKIYESRGNASLALSYYQKAISIHPDDIRGYLNLGNALVKLNKVSEAETAYRTAIGLVSKENRQIGLTERILLSSPQSTLNLHDKNKWNSKSEIKVTRMHLQALLNLATLISMDSSRLDEANSIFSNAAHLFPDYQITYSTWIQSMLHTNRNIEAERFLSKITQDSSQTNPDVLYNFALLVNKKGNTKNALILFDRILSFDPYHEQSLLTSARIIKDNNGLKEYEEVAIERFETIVYLGKADHTVYFDLGMLYIRKGQTKTAKKYFSEAIKMKPNFTQALFNMALLLYKEEKFSDALPFLECLLKDDEFHGKALILMIAINENKDIKQAQYWYNNLKKSEYIHQNPEALSLIN